MNRKILNWHGRNMDIVIEETANMPKWKYIYALAIAVKWILSELEKQSYDRNSN